jgi:polygalacturonase
MIYQPIFMRSTFRSILAGFLMLWLFVAGRSALSTYSIVDFGAKGDGKTLNTTAINKAIQTCHEQGGGTVLIPAGTFVSGTVILRSNVNFHLEAGAILMASRDTADYQPMSSTLFHEGYNRYGLIYAHNARNVFITGYGEINGQGSTFMNQPYQPKTTSRDFDRRFTRQGVNFLKEGSTVEDGPATYKYRPGLLMTLSHCENVQIQDIVCRDSPEWTIRIADCDGVQVRGITIENNLIVPNSDGIHCTTSRNVTIADSRISAGDDAIIVSGFGQDGSNTTQEKLLGNQTGIAENVTVTNCVLSSRSACIRIGYGEHPIRNVVCSNLVMYASNRGIGIFARNNSQIEHILFSTITIQNRLHDGHWWGKGEPIHISAVRDAAQGKAGQISDIRFTDITATSETGILIQGSPESVITNVSLDRIKLTINKGKHTLNFGGNFDLRPAYPLSQALFSHDIPGLYAQHVSNLALNSFQLDWGTGLPNFFTDGVAIDHFKNVRIINSSVRPVTTDPKRYDIRATNGQGLAVINSTGASGLPRVAKQTLNQYSQTQE